MNNFKAKLQDFGKSLLFPISLLSFMAIFLGLGAALQNPNILKYLPALENQSFQTFVGLVRKLAGLPFSFLPLLFAMSIPLGMVKRDKEVAVYSAVVGYVSMLITMNYILSAQGLTADTTSVDALMASGMDNTEAVLYNSRFSNVLGLYVYNTNVIGGIIAGIFGVWIHNKFRNTQLHPSLTFYSGKRFVPIISAILMVIPGALLTFIWPPINNLIVAAGGIISNAGAFGVFLYGMLEKLLIPTGMHHILNQTFRFTALGGLENLGGENVVGALQIFLYQLEHGLPFSAEATKYLAQGKILQMVFGMPAVVLAIRNSALDKNKEKVMRYYTAGLTAVILTGITEPIEFTYIFLSPLLWITNAILAGFSFLLPYLFGVTIGNVQGGIIDWLVFGVLQGTSTKWYVYLFLGPLMFAVYYFTFKFLIRKLNVKTVGKEDTLGEESVKELSNKSNVINNNIIAENIVNGLGGIDNIEDVDNCISRLRVVVKNSELINEDLIKRSEPMGIIRPTDKNIHIVYGGRVIEMRKIVDDYIYQNK